MIVTFSRTSDKYEILKDSDLKWKLRSDNIRVSVDLSPQQRAQVQQQNQTYVSSKTDVNSWNKHDQEQREHSNQVLNSTKTQQFQDSPRTSAINDCTKTQGTSARKSPKHANKPTSYTEWAASLGWLASGIPNAFPPMHDVSQWPPLPVNQNVPQRHPYFPPYGLFPPYFGNNMTSPPQFTKAPSSSPSGSFHRDQQQKQQQKQQQAEQLERQRREDKRKREQLRHEQETQLRQQLNNLEQQRKMDEELDKTQAEEQRLRDKQKEEEKRLKALEKEDKRKRREEQEAQDRQLKDQQQEQRRIADAEAAEQQRAVVEEAVQQQQRQNQEDEEWQKNDLHEQDEEEIGVDQQREEQHKVEAERRQADDLKRRARLQAEKQRKMEQKQKDKERRQETQQKDPGTSAVQPKSRSGSVADEIRTQTLRSRGKQRLPGQRSLEDAFGNSPIRTGDISTSRGTSPLRAETESDDE